MSVLTDSMAVVTAIPNAIETTESAVRRFCLINDCHIRRTNMKSLFDLGSAVFQLKQGQLHRLPFDRRYQWNGITAAAVANGIRIDGSVAILASDPLRAAVVEPHGTADCTRIQDRRQLAIRLLVNEEPDLFTS